MPEPLSDTSISSIPSPFSRTSTRVAPASMAFSTSSRPGGQGYVPAQGGVGWGANCSGEVQHHLAGADAVHGARQDRADLGHVRPVLAPRRCSLTPC